MTNLRAKINAAVNAFKAGYKEAMNPTIFKVSDAIMTFEGYYVFKNTQVIESRGLAFAMTANLKTTFASIPVIVVSDEFESFSEQLQNFILWHEVGHIKNGHIEKMERGEKSHGVMATSMGVYDIWEHDADNYAFENYVRKEVEGCYYKACRETRKILAELIRAGRKKGLPNKSIRELKMRKRLYDDSLASHLLMGDDSDNGILDEVKES